MINESSLTDLLPAFRQCVNYADRLAFWQEQNLTEELYYDLPSELECYYPTECQIGEYSIFLPILTIAPFTEPEANQFVEWALRERPKMKGSPKSLDGLINEFKHEYCSHGREIDRLSFLEEARESANRWVDDIGNFKVLKKNDPTLNARDFVMNSAEAGLKFEELGLDSSLYIKFLGSVKKRKKPNLIEDISLSQVCISWKVIDTYLFVYAKYEFSVFLEKFDPNNFKAEPIIENSIDNKSADLTRKRRSSTETRYKEYREMVDWYKTFEQVDHHEAIRRASTQLVVSIDTIERALGWRK